MGVGVGVESGMAVKSTPTHSHVKVRVKRTVPMGGNYCTPTPILDVGVQEGSVRLDERGDGSDGYGTAAFPH